MSAERSSARLNANCEVERPRLAALPAARAVQIDAIWRALQSLADEPGLAPEVVVPDPAALPFELITGPLAGAYGLVGRWCTAQGARCGELVLHADGSFHAEYDILRTHPLNAAWFIEALTAWGRDADVRSEPRILSNAEASLGESIPWSRRRARLGRD